MATPTWYTHMKPQPANEMLVWSALAIAAGDILTEKITNKAFGSE